MDRYKDVRLRRKRYLSIYLSRNLSIDGYHATLRSKLTPSSRKEVLSTRADGSEERVRLTHDPLP